MFKQHNRTDFNYLSEELSISLKASAKHLFLCAFMLSLKETHRPSKASRVLFHV